MELKDYWRIIKYRRWQGLIGGIVVFVALWTFLSLSQKTVYVSQGRLLFRERTNKKMMVFSPDKQLSMPPNYTYPISERIEFFTRRSVLKKTRKFLKEKTGIKRSIKELQKGLNIQKIGNRVFKLTYTDRKKAVPRNVLKYFLKAFRPYDAKQTGTFIQQKIDSEKQFINCLKKNTGEQSRCQGVKSLEEVQQKINQIQQELGKDFSPVAAIFPEKRMQSINSRLSKLDREHQQYRRRRSELLRNINTLRNFRKKLNQNEKIPEAIVDRFDLRNNMEISPLIKQRQEVRKTLNELLGPYKNNHPRVQRNKRLLQQLNQRISQKFREILQDEQLDKIQSELQEITQKKSQNAQEQQEATRTIVRLSNLREKLENLRQKREEIKEKLNKHQDLLRLLQDRFEGQKYLVKWSVPPNDTNKKRSRNPKRMFLLSLLMGIFGAIATSYLLEYFSSAIRTSRDVRVYFGLDTLASIPNIQEGPVLQIESAEIEQGGELYHRLAVVFRSLRKEIRGNTFLMTSGKAGEGKTSISLNMAAALARTGTEVLMLDTDLRNPALHRYLDRPLEQGVSNIVKELENLDGSIEKRDVVSRIKEAETEVFPGFSYVSAGDNKDNPLGMLNSKGMQRLFGQVRKDDRFVICDSPPLEPIIDAAVLSEYVDGTVLVVEEQNITHSEAAQYKRTLNRVGANILGVILNKVESAPEGYYYYYYDTKQYRR